jgi:hypothetical protein
MSEIKDKEATQNQSERSLKHYFKFGEFFHYFTRVFKKHDDRYPSNFNLRMMHGINKVSIIMFSICLIVILTRLITRWFF